MPTPHWRAPPRLGTAPVWRWFARELTAPGSDLMNRVAGSFVRVEGLEGADHQLTHQAREYGPVVGEEVLVR